MSCDKDSVLLHRMTTGLPLKDSTHPSDPLPAVFLGVASTLAFFFFFFFFRHEGFKLASPISSERHAKLEAGPCIERHRSSFQ